MHTHPSFHAAIHYSCPSSHRNCQQRTAVTITPHTRAHTHAHAHARSARPCEFVHPHRIALERDGTESMSETIRGRAQCGTWSSTRRSSSCIHCSCFQERAHTWPPCGSIANRIPGSRRRKASTVARGAMRPPHSWLCTTSQCFTFSCSPHPRAPRVHILLWPAYQGPTV